MKILTAHNTRLGRSLPSRTTCTQGGGGVSTTIGRRAAKSTVGEIWRGWQHCDARASVDKSHDHPEPTGIFAVRLPMLSNDLACLFH
ncbi:MAG: hypothetical protein FWC97_09560 [Treponema sp.]|nr:hypothetical protein [Treponema sp.]